MGISPFGGFGGIMFTIVPVIVAAGFIFVFGTIIVRSIRGAKEWKRNNDSPQLTVDAAVVTKRPEVSYHNHSGGEAHMHHTSSSTVYYATFEVESGDRMEFGVPNKEYGLLVEGDRGRLTFQGTRYLGFERSRG
ncbi:MAG: DUF2500 domain-containing protein [Clostridiales bacterium]